MKIHQLETLGYDPTEWLASEGVSVIQFFSYKTKNWKPLIFILIKKHPLQVIELRALYISGKQCTTQLHQKAQVYLVGGGGGVCVLIHDVLERNCVYEI